MRDNHLKAVLKSGGIGYGVSLQQFRTSETPRIFGAAGADFVWMDAEHGLFDFETIQDLSKAAIESGVTPLVRVAELSYALVARALDGGAHGVILPRVEDPERLRDAISWTRFPPLGRRGFGIGLPQLGYVAVGFTDIIRHQNENTLCIVQIESVEAIHRLPELLSIEGFDVALVGPADLSISLGCAGEFTHPRLTAAIEEIVSACAKHSVVAGIHVRNAALAQNWIKRGMRFVSVGSEATLLYEKATELFSELREGSRRENAAAGKQ